MNTSSTSPSKTLITAEPKPKARKRMESASASTAPSWMSFTGWRSAKKIYRTIDELQTDLDVWITEYNEHRPHQGRWCFGKTPMQTFPQHRLSDQVSANTLEALRWPP